jgi:hypothetical protein
MIKNLKYMINNLLIIRNFHDNFFPLWSHIKWDKKFWKIFNDKYEGKNSHQFNEKYSHAWKFF